MLMCALWWWPVLFFLGRGPWAVAEQRSQCSGKTTCGSKNIWLELEMLNLVDGNIRAKKRKSVEQKNGRVKSTEKKRSNPPTTVYDADEVCDMAANTGRKFWT